MVCDVIACVFYISANFSSKNCHNLKLFIVIHCLGLLHLQAVRNFIMTFNDLFWRMMFVFNFYFTSYITKS